MKSNKEIEEHLYFIGRRVADMEDMLHGIAMSQANLYQLFSERVDSLTFAEREQLQSFVRKTQADLQTLKPACTQFREIIEKFGKP